MGARTTGRSEGDLGPVHGDVTADLDLSRRESAGGQSRFEREAATDQEPDRVVGPFAQDVPPLFHEVASLVDAVKRGIGADVAVGGEVRRDDRIALFGLAEERTRDRVPSAQIPEVVGVPGRQDDEICLDEPFTDAGGRGIVPSSVPAGLAHVPRSKGNRGNSHLSGVCKA